MPIVSVRDNENNAWKINVFKKWQNDFSPHLS